MATGPKVSTYTFLSPNMELHGWVKSGDDNLESGTPLGERDHFDLLPDPAFNAIMEVAQGNGYIRCIARLPDNTITNTPDPGDLPEIPTGTRLTKLGSEGTSDLQVGDHIRLRGHLWLVHDPALFPVTDTNGLQYSQTYLVLQPFTWDKIEEINPFPAINDGGDGSLGVVTPLFRHRYLEGSAANVAAGVDGHIFLADDGSNFANQLTATAQFDAPSLAPSGFQPDVMLVSFEETLLPNSAVPDGNVVVRQMTKIPTGIEVNVTVSTSPGDAEPTIADLNHPLAFAAHYRVFWVPRILPEQLSYQLQGFTQESTKNVVHVLNRGIETLQITGLNILQDPDNTLQLLTPLGTSLIGRSDLNTPGVTEIEMMFTPPYPLSDPPHHVDAILELTTNDPLGQPIRIELQADPPPNPKTVKDTKDDKDSKEIKEKNEKENKEFKDKENKDRKDKDKDTKDTKERKETKDRKELKERKDNKDDLKSELKREKVEIIKESDIPIKDSSFSNHSLFPVQPGLQAEDAASRLQGGMQRKVFIRAAERPVLGERALRQPRRNKPGAQNPTVGEQP